MDSIVKKMIIIMLQFLSKEQLVTFPIIQHQQTELLENLLMDDGNKTVCFSPVFQIIYNTESQLQPHMHKVTFKRK